MGFDPCLAEAPAKQCRCPHAKCRCGLRPSAIPRGKGKRRPGRPDGRLIVARPGQVR